MRTDANQIAFNVVRSILDGARPLALKVAGTEVSVAVSREAGPPWPEGGVDGVVPEVAMLAPVRAECIWPGGKVTLFVDCLRSRAAAYRGDVCLRVATENR